MIVLLYVVHAVVDGILWSRFLDRAVFVPGVVDERVAKFGSRSGAVLPAEFLQVIVHLSIGKHLRTENNQVHVGIDVRLLIVNWFCWAFEEPVTPVYMLRPEWFLSESAQRANHFGSGSDYGLVNEFVVDRADAEPPEGYHSNVMMTFLLEF